MVLHQLRQTGGNLLSGRLSDLLDARMWIRAASDVRRGVGGRSWCLVLRSADVGRREHDEQQQQSELGHDCRRGSKLENEA